MAITYGNIIAAKADAVAPLSRYADGYGPKQPTRYWVRLAGDGPKWRRVYCMQYGNAGSVYVVVKGEDVFLNDIDIEIAVAAAA